jgi:hypothetical protein
MSRIMFGSVQYLRYFILRLAAYGRDIPFRPIISTAVRDARLEVSSFSMYEGSARLGHEFCVNERGSFASDFPG